jgi:PKD repeat protein
MSIFVSETGGTRRRARRGEAVAAVIASLAVVASVLAPLSAASADTASTNPSDPRTPETVSTDSLPVPQIGDGLTDGKDDLKGSGVVRDQLVIGDTVYVGGYFQYARPFGARAGEKVVVRSNFLAYDLETGALLDYAPSFNGQVRSLAASPDGTRLYVGGDFTTVNGVRKERVAAFDVASGALDASFSPEPNKSVIDLSASATTVYLAGAFVSVGDHERQKFAAVDAQTGALQPWAPVPATGGPTVNRNKGNAATKTRGNSILVSPDGRKVVVAGVFWSMNGSSTAGRGMAALDATTGASLPWKVNSVIKNGTDMSSILDLTTDGTSVYGAGFKGITGEGFFEGVFKASWVDGTLEWMTDCHGDSYSVVAHQGAVYTASHAHNCAGVGGFGDKSTSVSTDEFHRALAFSEKPTGKLRTWTGPTNHNNFGGQPAPSLLDWYPDLAPGKFTDSIQAAWDVTAAGDYVLFGGELTAVNGVKQRGLARFGTKPVAPNLDGPQLDGADMKPTVTDFGGTYLKLSWPANYDRDNARLTYQVIRDGRTDAPVFETTVESRFWQRPTIRAVDGYLTPGKTYTYQIRALDPFGNARLGDRVSYTVPAGAGDGRLTTYDRVTLQDQPLNYWPSNERSGNKVLNWARTDHMTPASAKWTVGLEKPTAGGAITYTGLDGSRSTSTDLLAAPSTYSVEAWFVTSARKGGKIVGFENGSSFDRHIYMDKAGRVSFGTHAAGNKHVIYAPRALNDGRWHHVVGSLSVTGVMQFFVDGVRVGQQTGVVNPTAYSGRWVVGGGQTWADGNSASSRYFAGTVDNVATYTRAVTPDVVARHYAAVQAPKPNVAPVASFSSSVSDLTASVDGRGSSDSDGKIVAYAWDFGDGATASDARASHAYAAAGTYRVSLTVTDDRGGKASTSKDVTVTAPPEPETLKSASDAFDRSVASGWGAAPQGGAWKQAGSASGFSVASGAGVIATAAGQTRTVTLPELMSTSTDSVVSFSIAEAPASGSQYVSVIGRQVGSEAYTARVVVQSNGVLQLQVRRGATTLKAVNVSAAVYAAGKPVSVRFQVSGVGTTTLNAKVWTTGAEPAAWNVTTTDTTAALQAKGTVGLGTYVPASAPTTTVSFLDYRVTPVG